MASNKEIRKSRPSTATTMIKDGVPIDHVRTSFAMDFLDVGKTKFWSIVARGFIDVIKPEGPNSKIGYVSLAQLRKYKSGELVK